MSNEIKIPPRFGKLLNFRTALAQALTRPSVPAHDWWLAFCAEMRAIGADMLDSTPEDMANDEVRFTCPRERIDEAKAIVKRYTAKE